MAEPQKTEKTNGVKELELDGVKFIVDTDLLDDVDAFGLINKIENDNQITAVVPLMHYLVGKEEFERIRDEFTKLDAEAHKDDVRPEGMPPYKPRLRIEKLGQIYQEIIKNFDPKG